MHLNLGFGRAKQLDEAAQESLGQIVILQHQPTN